MHDETKQIEEVPFWRSTALRDMTAEQWESLCDGCGRCCLIKLEDEDTGETYFTDVACFMLEPHSCQCSDYENRKSHVPDCITLTPDLVDTIEWLPPTCAYKLVAAGEDLYWWHPLVSGDPDTVHSAGVSVRGRVAANDREVDDDEWEDYFVTWPMRVPKSAARRVSGTSRANLRSRPSR